MAIARNLIIIGNGYDLHCGLRTKCSDFQKFLRTNQPDFFRTNLFAILFDEIYIKRSYTEEYSAAHRYEEPIFTKVEKEEIEKHARQSRWMDIEMFLMGFLSATTLKQLYKDIKQLYDLPYRFTPIYTKEYRIQKPLFSVFMKFMNKPNKENTSFVDFLYKQLNDYELWFATYLRNVDKGHEKEKKSLMYKIAGKKEPEFYAELDSSIICFNYTSFYREAGIPCCSVHGSVAIDTEKFGYSPIIIGIDYESIARKKISPEKNVDLDLYENIKVFTKTYRKLKLEETLLKNNFKMPDKNYLGKIIFYGHSLGEQDYSYFQSIFDYYNIYEKNITLEFCYSNYKDDDGYEIKQDIIEKELNESIFKLINKYGQTFSNKDHGTNLLHKLLLENRIKLRLID